MDSMTIFEIVLAIVLALVAALAALYSYAYLNHAREKDIRLSELIRVWIVFNFFLIYYMILLVPIDIMLSSSK
jgi:hypothetical protein